MGLTSSSPETMSFVDGEIKNQKVVIFSKSDCPHCDRAKRAVELAGGKDIMVVHELDKMGTKGKEIQRYLGKLTKIRTVPNTFVGGKNMGGADNTEEMQRQEKLGRLISDLLEAEAEAKAKAEAEKEKENQ